MGGAPASYDLNAVADALAEIFDGVLTGEELNGVAVSVTAYADVPGTIEVPAVVLELDDIQYDLTMGGGMDEFTFVALLLVEYQDMASAQRALRSFMSRDGGFGKLKAALEADTTLGGLVSIAHMTGVRRIGGISYGEATYLGAEVPIEVTS
jgi:hypothetical protein